MRSSVFFIAFVSVFFVNTSLAGGLSVEPGLWEMNATMTMSMMPQPQTTTTTECIKEDVLDPETFNMDEENPCEITDMNTDSNSARWNISCPTEGGMTMEGAWEVTSTGDTLKGKGKMSTEFSGQKMGFDMVWDGKRIGDCE